MYMQHPLPPSELPLIKHMHESADWSTSIFHIHRLLVTGGHKAH